MTTIRTRILQALADRFATATGWTSRVRRAVEDTADSKVAIVYHTGEGKRQLSGGCGEYTCDLSIGVAIDVDTVAIDPEAEPFDVLDEAIAELERVFPAVPDPAAELGIASLLELQLVRSRVHLPSEELGTMQATLSIEAQYRHDVGDPSTWGGVP